MTSTVPRCNATWIETVSGRQFYPLNPDPSQVCIHDIAHALSNMARYNGHTREFYSVAQHSVLVSRLVAPYLALPALLHDASEAYIADITSPIKPYIAGYRDIEDRIMAAVYEAFDYTLTEDEHKQIKVADITALVTERRDLMAHAREWAAAKDFVPHPARIEPLSPSAARHLFKMRFREVTRDHLTLSEVR